MARILNSYFDAEGARPGDYYPNSLHPKIVSLDERIQNFK